MQFLCKIQLSFYRGFGFGNNLSAHGHFQKSVCSMLNAHGHFQKDQLSVTTFATAVHYHQIFTLKHKFLSLTLYPSLMYTNKEESLLSDFDCFNIKFIFNLSLIAGAKEVENGPPLHVS